MATPSYEELQRWYAAQQGQQQGPGPGGPNALGTTMGVLGGLTGIAGNLAPLFDNPADRIREAYRAQQAALQESLRKQQQQVTGRASLQRGNPIAALRNAEMANEGLAGEARAQSAAIRGAGEAAAAQASDDRWENAAKGLVNIGSSLAFGGGLGSLLGGGGDAADPKASQVGLAAPGPKVPGVGGAAAGLAENAAGLAAPPGQGSVVAPPSAPGVNNGPFAPPTPEELANKEIMRSRVDAENKQQYLASLTPAIPAGGVPSGQVAMRGAQPQVATPNPEVAPWEVTGGNEAAGWGAQPGPRAAFNPAQVIDQYSQGIPDSIGGSGLSAMEEGSLLPPGIRQDAEAQVVAAQRSTQQPGQVAMRQAQPSFPTDTRPRISSYQPNPQDPVQMRPNSMGGMARQYRRRVRGRVSIGQPEFEGHSVDMGEPEFDNMQFRRINGGY